MTTNRASLAKAVVAAMEVAADEPMRWGVDDCGLWCADIIRSEFGFDPCAEYRGRYRTRCGAMRVYGDVLRALRKTAKRHKWRRIDPALAQAGDVGMAWTEYAGRKVLATVICRDRGWFAGRHDKGVTLIRSTDRVAIAWSVLPDALQTQGGGVSFPTLRAELNGRLAPTSAATHDPVSDVIGLSALIGSFGASASVATAIGGALVTAAGSIALSIGVSFQGDFK